MPLDFNKITPGTGQARRADADRSPVLDGMRSLGHDTLLLENIHVESGQMTGRQPLTYVRRLQYEFLIHNREARDCARFTPDGLWPPEVTAC